MANVRSIDSKADNGIFVIYTYNIYNMWDCIINVFYLRVYSLVKDFSKMFTYRCQKHDEMYKSNETLHARNMYN